jgi:hypothetical protein
VVTEQVLDTGRAVQVAERLEEDNPDWVIMYGSYSREYVAFPVYPDAPDNSYCSAKDPTALDGHIRETERRHGRVRLDGRRAVRAGGQARARGGPGPAAPPPGRGHGPEVRSR